MTVVFPDFVQQEGNTSMVVVQTMAAPGAPSLVTDIGATSSVNISCYYYTGGVPTKTQSVGNKPRRACSKVDRPAFGTKSYTITDIQYGYDPQAASSAAVNKARTSLAEGSIVYLVVRRGLDAQNTAFLATQKVDVWKVQLGMQNKTTTGDGEFDEFSITQPVNVLADPWEDVAIAA